MPWGLANTRHPGNTPVSPTTWGLLSILRTKVFRGVFWALYLLANRCLSKVPLLRGPVVFIAIPKSASKTIANRLAHSLGTKIYLVGIKRGSGFWPQNTVLRFRRLLFAVITGKIAHEHLVADRKTIVKLSLVTNRVVVHVRDPRQVLISMGHHFVEAEDGVTRFNINPEEINRNAPREMFDYLIANVFPVLVKYIDDWVAVSQTGPIKVTFVQYEEFIADDSAYFATLGRAIGESDLSITSTYSQHYRKGKTDEWREVLTPKQQELVNSGIPRAFLERFGWPSA